MKKILLLLFIFFALKSADAQYLANDSLARHINVKALHLISKYEDCLTGNLKLIPWEYRLKMLQDDHKQMRAMIFRSYPDFSEILAKLQILENKISLL